MHPHRALHLRLTSHPSLIWVGPALGGFLSALASSSCTIPRTTTWLTRTSTKPRAALAAKTFLRSFWGAGVVLFTEQMYNRLGDQWASSLLASISSACCAIPFLFWRYGARIRPGASMHMPKRRPTMRTRAARTWRKERVLVPH